MRKVASLMKPNNPPTFKARSSSVRLDRLKTLTGLMNNVSILKFAFEFSYTIWDTFSAMPLKSSMNSLLYLALSVPNGLKKGLHGVDKTLKQLEEMHLYFSHGVKHLPRRFEGLALCNRLFSDLKASNNQRQRLKVI